MTINLMNTFYSPSIIVNDPINVFLAIGAHLYARDTKFYRLMLLDRPSISSPILPGRATYVRSRGPELLPCLSYSPPLWPPGFTAKCP